MFDLLTYVLMLIPLILAGILVYVYLTKTEGWMFGKTPSQHHTVVKQDWVPTGRIDFAPPHSIRSEDMEQPNAFRLLVEERRIVESIAGNENLEIQWRLATLKEAKVVISQYHKYLSDNSLIKSVFDIPPPPSPSVVQIKPSDAPSRNVEPGAEDRTFTVAAVADSASSMIGAGARARQRAPDSGSRARTIDSPGSADQGR